MAVFIEHQLSTFNYDEYITTGYATQLTEYMSVTEEQFEALKYFCRTQKPKEADCPRYYLVEDVTQTIDLNLVLEEYRTYKKEEDERVAKNKLAYEKRLAKRKEKEKKQEAVKAAKKKANLMKELEKLKLELAAEKETKDKQTEEDVEEE